MYRKIIALVVATMAMFPLARATDQTLSPATREWLDELQAKSKASTDAAIPTCNSIHGISIPLKPDKDVPPGIQIMRVYGFAKAEAWRKCLVDHANSDR